MSMNKKKTKNMKHKGPKAAAAALSASLAEGGAAGLADGTEAAPAPAPAPPKDIDAHPLQCGHSVMVAYRDASHRLAKVSYLNDIRKVITHSRRCWQ
jgi:hypothetical protein